MQADLEFKVKLNDGYCSVRARKYGAPRFKPLVVGTGPSAGAALFSAAQNLIALQEADERLVEEAARLRA